MRGALVSLLVLAGAWLATRPATRCLLTRHDPARHPLGGQRCRRCGAAFADLDDAGLIDGAYVGPLRRLYDRDAGTLTRTPAFDPTRRGH